MNFLNKKYLQTFLAIGPFIAFFITIIGYFAFAFGTVIYAVSEPESDPSTFLTGGMVLFFILLIFSFFLFVANLIFFILHATKNPNLDKENMRLIWILIILFVAVMGLGGLIYWIVEIKTKNPKPVIAD